MIQQVGNNSDYNNYLVQQNPNAQGFSAANIPAQPDDSFVSTTKPEVEKKSSLATWVAGVSVATSGVLGAMVLKGKAHTKDLSKVVEGTLELVGEKLPAKLIDGVKRLREISTKDALSTMYNRRTFDAALSKTFAEAAASGSNLHMAMLDMDYFKSINEVLGHTKGDRFIQLLSKNIQEVGKKYGIKGYRCGGEEFAVLLPGHDAEASKKIIQEIADKIKADPEMQGHKAEFLTTIKDKLSGFHKEQAQYQSIWDSIRNPKAKQAEVAKMLQEKLGANPQVDGKEAQENLKKALVELSDVASGKNTSGRVLDIIEKYKPSISTVLNKKFNKAAEITHHKAWLEHVEANGFTISAGIAGAASVPKDKPEALLKLANNILEEAKRNNRNNISLG